MPTVNELVTEFNALATQANAQGLAIKLRNSPYKSIPVGQKRLAWLRAQLVGTSALPTYDAAIATQTFGPELEIIMPSGMTRYDLADKISAAGVPCVFSNRQHGCEATWTVVHDGSLPRQGAEVRGPGVVPLKGTDGLEQLRKVCDAMKAAGCTVNKKCGYHVHVGARAEGVSFFRQLVLVYNKYEPAIDSLMHPSRRNNHFAQSHRVQHAALAAATTVDGVMRAVGQGNNYDRYYKLNLRSFDRHGTVEFRQHQGTVDGNEAVTWAKLCMRLTAFAKVASSLEGDPTLAELFAKAAVPADEAAFLTSRAQARTRQAERAETRRANRLARLQARRVEAARVREERYQAWYNRTRNTDNVE
jgi:Putative amidoligase enzyme